MTAGYHFQLGGARQIDNWEGRALLSDDMGLGKTFQSLLWMHWHNIPRTVVVCPASLKINWSREAWMHFRVRADICSGRKPPKGTRLRQRLVIINYEILSGWMDKLWQYDPKLLIVDEAHRIQNRSSQAYSLVAELEEDTPHLICLTGTPITNRPAELWTLLNLVRPDKWSSFQRFAWAHCEPRMRYGKWEFKGAANLPKLHRRAKKYAMIRRLKQDVLKDLPKHSNRTIRVDIVDRNKYERAKNDILQWMRAEGVRGKTTNQVRALAQTNVLRQMVGQLKLPAIIEWIDNFLEETDRKLIVFGIHRKLLGTLHKRYGSNSVLVNGTTTPHKKQLNIDAFQHQKSVRLFFGNMRAAGEGNNLTAASDTLIIELPWVPKDIEQSLARANRIGQTQHTTGYFMLAEGTLEIRQCAMLRKKKGITDSALDGKAEDSLNSFDMLLHMLEK